MYPFAVVLNGAVSLNHITNYYIGDEVVQEWLLLAVLNNLTQTQDNIFGESRLVLHSEQRGR